jgi:hypothetical protein
MDVSPRLVPPGRVVLPGPFVAETFGCEVGWDDQTRAVLIGPPGRLAEVPDVHAVVEAQILPAVDGDTVEVEVGGKKDKVRLIAVQTPESTAQGEPYGKEAAAYTAERVEGRTMQLELGVCDREPCIQEPTKEDRGCWEKYRKALGEGGGAGEGAGWFWAKPPVGTQ